MAVTVETLDKLERKITLTLSADQIKSEVESRLKRLARTVKADGFRPGKVPMSVVHQRYGYQVQYEVLNDKVGEAFSKAAAEAQLRVAGAPSITEKEGASADGQVAFEATFEVYPEVKIGDLSSGAEIDGDRLLAAASRQVEVGGSHAAPIGHDDRALQPVLQLANIPWPRISVDRGERVRRQRRGRRV